MANVMKDVSNVAVIHTGYSNKAFLEFIHNLGISTVCSATGVKNLHAEALKYDISIYFESNGHGTVLFNKYYPELQKLQQFFHPTIGDGIMDMFAVLFILQEMKLRGEDWKDFYNEYPYSLFKMEVANKDEFLTTKNELRLEKPQTLQTYIDSVCDDDTRAFVRASGTENYLRVYVESGSDEMVEGVKEKLNEYINSNYKNSNFEKNGTVFEISDLSKYDYHSNYFHLLKQLTEIDANSMEYETFCQFVEKLNEHHIIKLIKIKESQQIVGSITVLIEEKLIHNFGKVGHLEDVVVDESMRGCGLGKKLLEIAEGECSECYKLILDCSDENIKFYEKCGYEWKGNQMARYL
jgi:ribosomal protein S18 acetylase RimI-like enzyme